MADVPCGGRQLLLRLQAHKFFCDNTPCPRKVFTERFTPFAAPWARLSQALLDIGLTTCGKSGARLAKRLGMLTSSMTILRRIMRLPAPAPSYVKQLGIDDWAFRRGRTYGTLLVDLEKYTIMTCYPTVVRFLPRNGCKRIPKSPW